MVGASSIAGGGGSNTFIRGLARRQVTLGWHPVVVVNESLDSDAIASFSPATHASDEPFTVRSLPPVQGMNREAYYSRRPASAPEVAELFYELRPSVVHFHTLNASAGALHLEAAKAANARTIVTYHTGGISCPQTGLLENGKSPCDGALDVTRCTRCRFANRGLPVPLAEVVARLRVPYIQHNDESLLARLLSSRDMTQAFISSFRRSLQWIDVFHIQSDWIRAVLRANDVPSDKIAFVEMGVSQAPIARIASTPASFTRARPLRLVFAGRCSDIKGIETILGALRKLPINVPLEVSLLGTGWESPYGRRLLAPFARDRRLRPPRSVSADVMLRELAAYDACLVPSIWLETGPLVVYEAMAAGLPVIGSRLGGIAERVRDYVDGRLFRAGSSSELAKIIDSLLSSPKTLSSLRNNIKPQRTFDDMARELAGVYRHEATECAC
ncbi:MAG: glycosyltransferase [Hyphomicrobium sp.]